jgi:sulfur relay (sulfurtransferase) DsrC/TusE family protein
MSRIDMSLIEPMFVQDKIAEIVPKVHRENDQWNFRCPICGDSRKNSRQKRGHYYISTNSYFCFNENCNASGLWIIAKFEDRPISDVRKEFIEYVRKYYDSYKTSEHVPETAVPVVKKVQQQTFNIPDNWMPLPSYVENYLDKRMIYRAPYLPSNYQFYYNRDTKRLVICWVENSEIRYYQERALNSRQIPKYLFPKDANKHVFGLDRLDDTNKYMYLIEGFLDCIYVYNGVCIGSVNMTSGQKEILDACRHEKVFMFDNQWKDETSYNLCFKIARDNPGQKMFIWPRNIVEKDVNEYFVNHYPDNPFVNPEFLESRIMSGIRAMLELKHRQF